MSLGCAVAYGLWAVAVSLFSWAMFTGEIRVLAGGFLVMGIAATATVRSYFLAFSKMVRKAFEMEDYGVTHLRR